MKRRDFMTALAGATTWASGAYAQEPRHVIGFLAGHSFHTPGQLAAFYQGLKETGFVEGKNLRSFPDFAGKERFAFGEQRTSCPSLA
jgi:hypothetical protein